MNKWLQYALVATCVAALGLLAWQVRQSATLIDERDQLAKKLADSSERQNLELQGKCSEQARRMWHELGWDTPTKDVIAQYESHYSRTSQKCFMSITSTIYTKTNSSLQRTLMDAFEQRVYGDYTSFTESGQPVKFSKPAVCRLTPSSRDERDCASEEEFSKYVAAYME